MPCLITAYYSPCMHCYTLKIKPMNVALNHLQHALMHWAWMPAPISHLARFGLLLKLGIWEP